MQERELSAEIKDLQQKSITEFFNKNNINSQTINSEYIVKAVKEVLLNPEKFGLEYKQ